MDFSSAQPPFLPVLKKPAQRRAVRLVRAQLDRVNARRAGTAARFAPAISPAAAQTHRGCLRLAGVHFHDFARLGVLQNQPAQLRQFQFVAVRDLHRHHVVLAVRHAQRGLNRLGQRLRHGVRGYVRALGHGDMSPR